MTSVVTTTGPVGSTASVLGFETIAKLPRPGSSVPGNISFSPDDKTITFLHAQGDSLQRQLYGLDLDTYEEAVYVQPPGADTEENLSLEEKLRRERQRLLATGIQTYSWVAGPAECGGARLLVPLQGDIFVQDFAGPGKGTLRKIFDKASTGAKGGAIDAQVSPNGDMVAFVQDAEIYVAGVCAYGEAAGVARQVTQGARGEGKMNGLADFIAQEEMDRYRGFWWSPDSQSIAYEQVDESHIPTYRILHQGKNEVGDGAQEDHRYPFAGAANPHVKLGVVRLGQAEEGAADSSSSTWMDLGEDEDIYLARVDWMCDGTLTAQVENRRQTVLDLLAFDLATGAANRLLQETSKVWINLHNLYLSFHWQGNGGGAGKKCVYFLWGSERNGFMQLFLYQRTADGGAACVGGALTPANGVVEGVAGISPARNILYIFSTDEGLAGPPKRNLYAVPLFQGSAAGVAWPPNASVRVTDGAAVAGGEGTHSCKMNRRLTHLVDVVSNVRSPPVTTLYALPEAFRTGAGLAKHVAAAAAPPCLEKVHEIARSSVPDALKGALVVPTLRSLEVDSGHTLHAAVFRPDAATYGPGPYPLIVEVYGGPHVQRVRDSWGTTVNMRAQSFCNRGYLVLMLDNRGSFRRGLAFEGELYHKMGTVEVDDQASGVQWLVQEGLADPTRVGIYGWSYGGYMSLMCLMQRPDVFQVAVSGAPVTHWDGYDTHYTERYMGLPQENKDGYDHGSVMKHVANMKGSLMLIHGLIDENVHARHSFRLINEMIAQRKPYHLFILPNERHSPRNYGDRVYMEEQIFNFFADKLRG
jgi:dipeptidyl-peptidase-4